MINKHDMTTANERATEFKKELSALMKKWGTEIVLEDVGTGYNAEYKMKAYIDAVYGGEAKDFATLAEFTEVDLGSYID